MLDIAKAVILVRGVMNRVTARLNILNAQIIMRITSRGEVIGAPAVARDLDAWRNRSIAAAIKAERRTIF